MVLLVASARGRPGSVPGGGAFFGSVAEGAFPFCSVTAPARSLTALLVASACGPRWVPGARLFFAVA